MTTCRFPNESDEYRQAREELLREEAELRSYVERVASLRRKLPLGGGLKEDYLFDESIDGQVRRVRLSELFAPGKDTLIVYSFMYGRETVPACPLCTSIIDGFNGQAHHVSQTANFVVVARAPIDQLMEHARSRGWNRLRLLSSSDCGFNTDYLAEDEEGHQMPMAHVFVKRGGAIHHFWSSELLYADAGDGLDARHVDMLWPLWNILDLTPDGRGDDWYPKLSYEDP